MLRDDRPLALTRKEFAVLEELLRADGGAVSTEQLLEKAWDEHTDPFTNVVRVTVMTLRRKLGEPALVETVAGVGYQTLLEVAMSDPAASSDLRQVGSSLLTVNERSERLIDGLLLLARSENVVAERKPIDLADAARHAVGQLAQAAEDASVTIRPQLTPAVALGDPVLLERLVTNLVENAIRHNVPGGWAEVASGRAPGTGHPQLVVSNGGEEIPPYEVEELFEPFRRLRGERTADSRGSGLGLSIVRSIVAAHGGSVHAEARAGGGLVVRVTLPR